MHCSEEILKDIRVCTGNIFCWFKAGFSLRLGYLYENCIQSDKVPAINYSDIAEEHSEFLILPVICWTAVAGHCWVKREHTELDLAALEVVKLPDLHQISLCPQLKLTANPCPRMQIMPQCYHNGLVPASKSNNNISCLVPGNVNISMVTVSGILRTIIC